MRPLSDNRVHWRALALAAALWLTISMPVPLWAQSAYGDSDAQDARVDAILAMPGASTVAPLSNLYATSPGLEEQAPSPQWRFNALFPFGYNSNANSANSGGIQSVELNPFGSLSWATPVPGLPLRLTVTGNGESDIYLQAPDSNLDKLGGAARLQYVDANNDHAFSPYIAFAPRWDFGASNSNLDSSRQDFNIGFNKRFNFDGALQPVPVSGNTSDLTIVSFGVTAFFQERLREPQSSSYAFFLIPSVSYKISEQWSASLAVEFLNRNYETNSSGIRPTDWEAMPIGAVPTTPGFSRAPPCTSRRLTCEFTQTFPPSASTSSLRPSR
jgi:hypothetical protein